MSKKSEELLLGIVIVGVITSASVATFLLCVVTVAQAMFTSPL